MEELVKSLESTLPTLFSSNSPHLLPDATLSPLLAPLLNTLRFLPPPHFLPKPPRRAARDKATPPRLYHERILPETGPTTVRFLDLRSK